MSQQMCDILAAYDDNLKVLHSTKGRALRFVLLLKAQDGIFAWR